MDGGLTALGGFLFQTLGALSLKAAPFQEYHNAPHNKGDLELLFGFAKEGVVRYEDEDQDASIRNILHGEQAGYILIQYKYSSVSPCPPITASEMKKIISRLEASEALAETKGKHVTGYSLLTNRPLNNQAQSLIDAHPKTFYPATSLPERVWEERLRRFAHGFSCNEAEIEVGIRKSIGELLLRACQPRYYGEPIITSELLTELFTGVQQTHAVTPEIVAEKSRQKLQKLSAHPFHVDTPLLLVRPQVQERLSNLVETHAFVVLSGIGGNGKTAALWQWMQDCMTASFPREFGRYYYLAPSQTVQQDFFADLFCTWTHVPTGHPWRQVQTPEQFLDRLETARAAHMKTKMDLHPIFVLGLDAVDETFQTSDRSQRALNNVLLWFWEQEVHLQQLPRATLIVTCRNTRDLGEYWLSIVSPYQGKSEPFQHVEIVVDEFHPAELVMVARQQLPAQADRFEQTYRTLELQPSPELTQSLEATSVLHASPSAMQAVDVQVFQALCHPALWRCFLHLDEPVQMRVLDGDGAALEQLADRFLQWFCQKMRARGRQIPDEEAKYVLREIARQCDPRLSSRSRQQDWIKLASHSEYMNTDMAEKFYREALSSGLILNDNRSWWRWRHPFIGTYLASHASSEEDEQ